MFQKLTVVRRSALMLLLVMALVAALLPTAAYAGAKGRSGMTSRSYASGRVQPKQRFDHRFDRQKDHQDRFDKRPVVRKPQVRCETTYRVRKGDNLTKIARHFHTSVKTLTRVNNIRNPNRIFVGQTLCIR